MWSLVSMLLLLKGAAQSGSSGDARFFRQGLGSCLGIVSGANQTLIPTIGLFHPAPPRVSHGECRALCSTNDCLGYSYYACNQSCSVHGDPTALRAAPNMSAISWNFVNGSSMITASTGVCGSSCFLRLRACRAGFWSSGGTVVSYASFPFGATSTVQCPAPWRGALQLYCNLTGVELQSGACRRGCPSGTFLDGINKYQVPYPGLFHGDASTSQCASGGAQGSVTVNCTDGVVMKASGSCGLPCPPGTVQSGTAIVSFSAMAHNMSTLAFCPTGYVGRVRVLCLDTVGIIVSDNQCMQNCDRGSIPYVLKDVVALANYSVMEHGTDMTIYALTTPRYNCTVNIVCSDSKNTINFNSSGTVCYENCMTGTIGTGSQTVSHGIIFNNMTARLACPTTNETLSVFCFDGERTITGPLCNNACPGGSVTSNGVTLLYPSLENNGNISLTCPNGTTGTIVMACSQGTATQLSGYCGVNCIGGSASSNGAVVLFPDMPHGNVSNQSCPLPWGGWIAVRCYDASLRQTGVCGSGCAAGLIQQRGAQVPYPQLSHGESMVRPCVSQFGSLSFTTQVLVTCFNMIVTYIGVCIPNCNPGALRSNGIDIIYGYFEQGSNTSAVCGNPPDPLLGTAGLFCNQGTVQIVNGSCGQPCPAGNFLAAVTRFLPMPFSPTMAHLEQRWVNCPTQLSGKVYLVCKDKQLDSLAGSCGERCDSRSIVTYGVSFVSLIMDHNTTYSQNCTFPYLGSVTLSCYLGVLNMTNLCMANCPAGAQVIKGGALISYPDLLSGQTAPEVTCPGGFAGSVVLQCVNGTLVIFQGGCYSHCEAGRYMGPRKLGILYYAVLHLETQNVTCPSGYQGNLTLQCQAGSAVSIAGECDMDCPAGNAIIRGYLTTPNAAMKSGEITEPRKCPEGYNGIIRLKCFDSLVTVASGRCRENCRAGQISDASYPAFLDSQTLTANCSQAGSLVLNCSDGTVSVLAGRCYSGCPAGQTEDLNGVTLVYADMKHLQSLSGVCTGKGGGFVQLFCNDSVVAVSQTEKCLRNCEAGSVRSKEGFVVTIPKITHLQTSVSACPTGLTGFLTVLCNDSATSVVAGSCGLENCVAGNVLSNGYVLKTPMFNNGTTVGPATCSLPSYGEASLYCRMGFVVPTVTLVSKPVINDVRVGDPLTLANDTIPDDIFSICGCCDFQDHLQPPPPPPPPSGPSPMVIGIAAAGGGVLLVGVSASIFLRHRYLARRGRQVVPADKLSVDAESQLALRTPEEQLQLEIRRQETLQLQKFQRELMEAKVQRAQTIRDRADGSGWKGWQ